MGPIRHVCSRCGSIEYIEVSGSELRCAECGLGSTFARVTAVKRPDAPRTSEAGLDRLQAMMGQRDQMFTDAPFPVYGLDARWTGLRSLGGWGSSNGETTELSLAFGDVSDQMASQIRVQTNRPHTIGPGGQRDPAVDRFLVTRVLMMQLAHEVGELPDDVRAAAFPIPEPGAFSHDPTEPWDDAIMSVENVEHAAKVLTIGDRWVALVAVGGVLVGVNARGWRLAETGLEAVTDFRVYAEGSAELEAIMRRRHQPPI